MRRVTELNHVEARQFFLKEESYFNFDLPKYFVFETVIQKVSSYLINRNLSDCLSTYVDEKNKIKSLYPQRFENVNYKFLNNKDGKFAWRPFQLIHPALYVSLVHKITEENNWQIITGRFKEFALDSKISCYSIPLCDDVQKDRAISINQWWHLIEQQSIELSISFDYVLHIDVADCYGSIYTHAIAWAVHTKAVAKEKRDDKNLIGNIIDSHIRDMSFGQTNGIPQGSVLKDFVAEIVLSYADSELSDAIRRIGITDFKIIRYRDDYRIFTNNPQQAEQITKMLTEILIDLGMKLNTHKTLVSNNVIQDSIKPDKLFWIGSKRGAKSLQEHLLIIHALSEKFVNSGSVSKSLSKFYKRIAVLDESYNHTQVLISIIVDIMYKNPRTYPISAAILSKLLSLMKDSFTKQGILLAIEKKFEKIPNTGHLKIWLQRLTIKVDRTKQYDQDLCKKVNDPAIRIWNSDWLSDSLKDIIENTPIVNENIIDEIDVVINSDEVSLFNIKSEYTSYAR